VQSEFVDSKQLAGNTPRPLVRRAYFHKGEVTEYADRMDGC